MSKQLWLNKICKKAYEGDFKGAQILIDSGKDKNFALTKQNATDILLSCGIDIPYKFIKPLILMGGKIPKFTIKFAKEILKDKKAYDIWSKIPDRIKGFKFIIKITDNKK
jgi:hypothetical protein